MSQKSGENDFKMYKHPSAARLSLLENALPMLTHFFRWTISTHKVGQTDVVFGVWSEFISRSVHARLQVYGQRLWFVPPWLTPRHTSTHRQHFDQLLWKAELKVFHGWNELDTRLSELKWVKYVTVAIWCITRISKVWWSQSCINC